MNILDRITSMGLNSGSAIDLLAIGLANRPEDTDLTELEARRILSGVENLRRIGDLSIAELSDQGMTDFEALRCLAWLELGRKIGMAGRGRVYNIDCPDLAAQEFLKRLSDEKKEFFGALFLDSKNQLLKASVIHIGTLNMSVVGPRELFREAIREGACSIIVTHNHPSGDPEPSPEDIEVTRKLVRLGKELEIEVLDHIILGSNEFVSLRERRLMT